MQQIFNNISQGEKGNLPSDEPKLYDYVCHHYCIFDFFFKQLLVSKNPDPDPHKFPDSFKESH